MPEPPEPRERPRQLRPVRARLSRRRHLHRRPVRVPAGTGNVQRALHQHRRRRGQLRRLRESLPRGRRLHVEPVRLPGGQGYLQRAVREPGRRPEELRALRDRLPDQRRVLLGPLHLPDGERRLQWRLRQPGHRHRQLREVRPRLQAAGNLRLRRMRLPGGPPRVQRPVRQPGHQSCELWTVRSQLHPRRHLRVRAVCLPGGPHGVQQSVRQHRHRRGSLRPLRQFLRDRRDLRQRTVRLSQRGLGATVRRNRDLTLALAGVAALAVAELFALRAAALAGLVLLSSPVTVYYAHTTNLDIPYLCWTTAGLWLAVRVVRGDAAVRTHVLLGAAAALAIATKDQAYACFALLPLPLLWRRWQGGRLLDAKPLAALASFVVVYGLASLVAVDPAGYLAHARQLTGPTAMPYFGVPLSPARFVRVTGRAFNATTGTLRLPFAVACVAGLILAAIRRVRGAEVPFVMALSYYVTFIVPILYVVPRYVLPMLAAMAPFAGLGLAALWGDAESPRASARRALVCLVVAAGVARGASMDVRLLTDARYRAESWISANAPSGHL